ncbi:MAG: hypothetical protein RI911_732 [Candidatus Parcubacteria bacterium]|jgi:L-ascorbate metabolism protein UlaG (beta-lactamase superfamily)
MYVTKYGHCCLLIEIQGVRFLTDPGTFSELPSELHNIHYVVITHEHADHMHIPAVTFVMQKNPQARVISNTSVQQLLQKEGIACLLHEAGHQAEYDGVSLCAYGESHAVTHSELPVVQNTGYLFNDTLFYPGDALTIPGVAVDVLALPTAGPWIKLSEAIAYARTVQPRRVVPVHDGVYARPDMMNGAIEKLLQKTGISFVALPHGVTIQL